MKAEVHLLTWQEEAFIGYALKHYATFCSRMVVHDAFSKDGTREIALSMGAEVRDWDTGDRFNDEMAMNLKNACWKGTDADWVVCADADELIYFPAGAEFTLAAYEAQGVPMVKPFGYEMCSDVYPTTQGQIYDEVKFGARDDKWYAKPILFSPKRVRESGIGIGAHECNPITTDGRMIQVNREYPKSTPSCLLLHFHQLGSVERIAKLYDERRARLSQANIDHRWGNFDLGSQHAREKRNLIKAGLERVIP